MRSLHSSLFSLHGFLKKISLLLLVLYSLKGSTQQVPQYTQFMLNNYVMNPAAGGVSSDRLEMMVGIRRQWIGFQNPPRTTFFNINTYLGRRTGLTHGWHGIGVFWQGDRMGNIIHQNDFYASYTYLTRINRKGYIAFGLAAGARKYGVTFPKFDPDPVLASNKIWIYPDFIPGVKFWNSKWTLDLAVRQLYKNRIEQGGNSIGSPAPLPPQFYISASRKWRPRSYLLVIQSVHLKYSLATLPSLDYNMLAHLNKNFAVGISYRHLDAVAAMVQFRFDKLVIGLAYDYTISPYRIGFANSQELMLGLSPSPYSDGGAMKNYRTAECPAFQY